VPGFPDPVWVAECRASHQPKLPVATAAAATAAAATATAATPATSATATTPTTASTTATTTTTTAAKLAGLRADMRGLPERDARPGLARGGLERVRPVAAAGLGPVQLVGPQLLDAPGVVLAVRGGPRALQRVRGGAQPGSRAAVVPHIAAGGGLSRVLRLRGESWGGIVMPNQKEIVK
jgi:hypothetical protein